jgi:hypothetical protein
MKMPITLRESERIREDYKRVNKHAEIDTSILHVRIWVQDCIAVAYISLCLQ